MAFVDQPSLHELHREMIEQFGMRRGNSEHSHVVDCRDDAASEKVMPDAIHGDSRCQRAVQNLIREFQSTTAGFGSPGVLG